jgi:hypothetical protein
MLRIIVLLKYPWIWAKKRLSTWEHLTLKNAMVLLFLHDPVDPVEPTDASISEATPDHHALIVLHSSLGILGQVSLTFLSPYFLGTVGSDLKFELIRP